MKASSHLEEGSHSTEKFCPTGCGFSDTCQYLEESALAGTIGANDTEHFPVFDLERYII
jgi:hypothetical protein